MFKRKGLVATNNKKINKKVLIILLVFIVIFILFALILSGSLSNLMGNSVVEYYCEDTSFHLENRECVKEIKEKPAMLGDINLDGKIKNDDLDLLERYINYVYYEEEDLEASKVNELQIKAADIDQDGTVFYSDSTALREYLNKKVSTIGAYSENIGVKMVCPKEFTLNGTWCVKKELVPAKVKEQAGDTNKKFVIKFDNQNYQGTMPDMELTSNKNIKLIKNQFINGDKKFIGWTVFSSKQQKYLYYEESSSEINDKYIFKERVDDGWQSSNLVRFDDEAVITSLPVVEDDVLLFRPCFIDVNNDEKNLLRFDQNSSNEHISQKGKKIKIYGNFELYISTNGGVIYPYYKLKTYDYGTLVSESECRKAMSGFNVLLGDINVGEYTRGSVQLYWDSKCVNSFASEKKTGAFRCKDCNPVDITIEDSKETNYKKNSKVNIGINFNIKDKSMPYYYKIGEYIYGVYDYSNYAQWKCKKIDNIKDNIELTIDGTREIEVNLYDNDACNNPISTTKSKTYMCDDCNDTVDVSFNDYFDDERKNTYEKDSKYNLDIEFRLSYNHLTYYYIINNYLNGKLDNSTKCSKINSGIVDASSILNGIRKSKVTLYKDSECKNKIKEYESDERMYNGYYDTKVTITPQKAVTTNIQSGNQTTDNNIAKKSYIPNNTDLYLKLDFKTNNQINKYYYKIKTNKQYADNLVYYGNTSVSDDMHPFTLVHYSSEESKCMAVPVTGTKIEKVPVNIISNNQIYGGNTSCSAKDSKNYSTTCDSANYVKYEISLYTDDKCKNEVSTNNINDVKERTLKYNFQTFIVEYDVNGGVYELSHGISTTKDSNNYTYIKKFQKIFNYNNPIINQYNEVYRQGYDLIGYKVRNSSGKYMCYKDSSKKSSGYYDEATCKKNGYVIYKDSSILARTSGTNKETITFIAQWTDKPVEIYIGSLDGNTFKSGTGITFPVSFKVTDTANTYYYRWGPIHSANYKLTDSQFLNELYGLKYGKKGSVERKTTVLPYIEYSACQKIVANKVFNHRLTVDSNINAGIVSVYKDKNCTNMVSSLPKIRKTTNVIRCSNCYKG